MDKIAVYCASRNYYKHLLPAVMSLTTNSSVDIVYLLIEDNVFPYALPSNVKTINMKRQTYFSCTGPNYNSKWTYFSLLRVALPLIFYMHDKILYLDVDTIVNDNIDAIWDIDLGDNYFAAVKEIHKSTDKYKYFNAGVMLMNLKALRDSGIASMMINVLNVRKFDFCDQDCLNLFCEGKILEIPSYYNVNPYTEATKDKKIIHFAGDKNWENKDVYKYYMEHYSWNSFKYIVKL